MAHEITTNPLRGVELRDETRHFGVYHHGAHTWAWQPDGSEPVLWMSGKSAFEAGQPIRGGVPICFPWFGPGPSGDLQPAHGFLRLNEWELVEDSHTDDGGVRVVHAIDSDSAVSQPHWPHRFSARMSVTFGNRDVVLEFSVTNQDEQPITYEAALHTYLVVGDVRRTRVVGLDGARYYDKVAGEWLTQDGDVTISGETDRVYLSTDEVTLQDPELGRSLRISKEGSANTVVWNPWVDKSAAMSDFGDDEWTGMLCIEAANALEDAITVEPGEVHTLVQRISLA